MLLFNMQLGEVAPGGVGSGLYGMLILAIITVFVAGLMVGRTPEYLGKKITPREIKLAAGYFLVTPLIVLTGTAIAMALPGQRAGMLNSGPHGLSEVLYAFTSAANNNGSAFAGIAVNTTWYNTALGAGDGVRPVPADHPGAGAGRFACQAGPHPAIDRHPAHPPTAVRRHGRRRDAHPGRPDLPADARARPARRRNPLMSTVHRRRARRRTGAARRPSACRAACSTPKILWRSLPDALRKLDPRTLWRNPVMFIVEIGAVWSTVLAIAQPELVRLADRRSGSG